jgi:hypothetical protein
MAMTGSFVVETSLFLQSLPRYPFANVWGTMCERDASFLTLGEELDVVLASQGQTFQVQYDGTARWFRAQKLLQFDDVFFVHPASKSKHCLSVG